MTAEWLRRKEFEQIRARNAPICEARATEKLLEEKRLKVISRGEECDYQRILSIAREEIELEENLTREKKATEQAHSNLEWTRKIAEEVSRLKNEETLERKQRQLLGSTCLELRQLEKQLRNAYNAKSLQIQLKEREAIRANTRCRELQQDKAIKHWYQNDHSMEDNLVQAHEKRERYRHDLQKQLIANRQIKTNLKSAEDQNDRKLREEIARNHQEEETQKIRQKEETIIRLKIEKEAFLRAKQISELEDKKSLLDEHKRNERIIAEKENRAKKAMEVKMEKLAAKEKMREEMAAKMLDDEKKRMEREDIIKTLHDEDEKITMQAKLRKQSLEKRRLAKELLEDMLRQRKARDERKAHDLAIDTDFARYIVQQNQIGVKQEQEKIHDRRLRGLRYGEDLKAQIAKEKTRKIEERRRQEESIANDKKAENARKQEIFEEYSRIVEMNAPELEGFFKLKNISLEDFDKISKQLCVNQLYAS